MTNPRSRRRFSLSAAVGGLCLSLAAGNARAQTAVDCSTPSGLGSHACTFPEGQVVVETSLVDATLDDAGGLRTTSLLVGDTLVHVGVRHGLEAQIGWAPFDHERTADRRTGEVTSTSGVGDVVIGGKLAILSNDRHPLGIAIQPSLVIPVGDLRLGSGSVGGGVLLPITYDLSDAISLELTPEAESVGDRNDDGRHLEYGATLGLDWAVGARVSATVEYRRTRDQDPAFHRTKQLGAVSIAWMPTPRLQLNAGVAVGLTPESPRSEVIVGLARHFR